MSRPRRSCASFWPIWPELRLALCSLLLLLTVLPGVPTLAPVYAGMSTRQNDPAAQCAEGMQLAEAGRTDAALPLLAAGVAGATSGVFDAPELPGACAATLGRLLQDQGRLDDALAAYATALQFFETQPNDAATLDVIERIGAAYAGLGQTIEALEAYRRARDLARALEDRPREMVALANMFRLFHEQRHWREALELTLQMQQVGRAITEETGDGLFESIGLLFTMVVLVGQWRCTEAPVVGQQALDLARDDERFNVAGTVAFSNGQCALIQQRYDEALEFYRQAVVYSRALGDHDIELLALDGVARVHRTQQRYDEALDVIRQALQRARALDDRDREADLLGAMGSIYSDQARYDQALNLSRQALQIARDRRDRFGEAFQLLHMGEMYRHQRRYDEALATHQRALQIAREMGFRELEGFALTYLGEDYAAQQRLDEALDAGLQALDVYDTVRTTAGSDAARIGIVEQNFFAYDRPVWLAHQLGRDDLAFAISERGRARAFLDGLATGTIELSDDATNQLFQRERETALTWLLAQDALNQARASRPSGSTRLAELEARVEAAEAAHAAALRAIDQRGGQLAALVPGRMQAPLARAEVQALLPPRTTLVSYWLGGDQTLAFVLSADQFQTIALPVGVAEVTRHVRQLRSVLISAPPTQRISQPSAAVWLHRQLIAPLRPYLRTSRLLIVPHASLHHLPFAALGDERGRMLLDEFTLTLLPSASTLRFLERPASAPVAAPRALVLANADYTLPSAAAEAQAIADLFDSQLFLGSQATEQALRAHAGQAGILHIATHGEYLPDAPLASYLTLAPGSPEHTPAATRGSDEPSGARLEVADVYGLDLRQTDLVVLSACQSNLSAWTSGDDMVGLTRAFLYAGASSVVASLWLVPDKATSQLMERFYTHLRAGSGKAEALQKAQQEIRARYPSPYYWAGFVLLGEGEGALVAVPWWQRLPWWAWPVALSLAIVGIGGAWRQRNRWLRDDPRKG